MAEYGTYIFKPERLHFAVDQALKERNISMKAAAKEIGVSNACISTIRSGDRRSFSVRTLGLMCTWLGIPPNAFFDAS